MSEVKFESALESLNKPQDSKSLLKILLAIRKEVEWPRDKDNVTKLREAGVLKHIVQILQSPHKNILDVNLSILGNCVMDKGCSRDVVGMYNILSPLNHLLKRFNKEDSINGRIFRIVGNLCQHRDQWANTMIDRKPQLVTHLVDYVKRVSKDKIPHDEKISDATVLMAIRALRLLLNCQTVEALVKNFGVLKAIGSLFIKYSLRWQIDKSHKNLLVNIVRLIQDYSRYKLYCSIQELRNTNRGDSLIHLSDVLVLAPRSVVKIIMNLIRISQLRSELPVVGICDRFIEVLKEYSIIKEFDGECLEYLQCLSYLLEHPANRNAERCGKCLPLLVELLKEFAEPTNNALECCVLLVSAMNRFRFDASLMQGLLRNDIVNILTAKLHWLVSPNDRLNLKHAPTRRMKFVYDPGFSVLNASSDDETELVAVRSPSPCSSTDSDLVAMSWSPAASPRSGVASTTPPPPPGAGTAGPSDTDSDDYSPVCSEADASEPAPEAVELEEEPGAADGGGDGEDNGPAGAGPARHDRASVHLRNRLLVEASRLVRSLAKLEPAAPQLASLPLLVALLKCSRNFEWPHSPAVDTLPVACRLLDAHARLVPLLVAGVAEVARALVATPHPLCCARCGAYSLTGERLSGRLVELAESGVGEGELAAALLRGGDTKRKAIAMAVPFVIENKRILRHLMIKCGALDVLVDLLKNEAGLRTRLIAVVCQLAKKLMIANPAMVKDDKYHSHLARNECDSIDWNDEPIEDSTIDNYPIENYPQNNIVTFLLDDGSRLKANRSFLSEKSDFFNALLNGDFKERSESHINLKKVDLKPFRCLLTLLELFSANNLRSDDVKFDLDTLLEVILLCDRFLLADLCAKLTEVAETSRISSESVAKIYKWSVQSGTNFLRVESVAFALVVDTADKDRIEMFARLFETGLAEDLADDVGTLLRCYLFRDLGMGRGWTGFRVRDRSRDGDRVAFGTVNKGVNRIDLMVDNRVGFESNNEGTSFETARSSQTARETGASVSKRRRSR